MLLDFLKAFEGFSPVPYGCPGGYQTIGYGHKIKRDEVFEDPLSKEEAEKLLESDVALVDHYVRVFVRVPLLKAQREALISFTFNVGPAALERSTLRRTVNREEHGAVPRELMKWVWSGGRRLMGLVRRRQAEGLYYMGKHE